MILMNISICTAFPLADFTRKVYSLHIIQLNIKYQNNIIYHPFFICVLFFFTCIDNKVIQ